jgi:peptide/nickel transport system permease protein
MAGMQLGQGFSGAVLVELVFSLPGIGPLLYDSIIRHDYPVMLGILFGSALAVVVANILTDLMYRLLDPRIRLHNQ